MNRFIAEKVMEVADYGYWWCSLCLSEKSPVQVTYHENCTVCGTRVEWRGAPDYTTPADKCALMDFCVRQKWWGNFVSIWLIIDYFKKHEVTVRPTQDIVFRDVTRYLWRNLPELVAEYRGWKG